MCYLPSLRHYANVCLSMFLPLLKTSALLDLLRTCSESLR
jgi:hypothetical protein